MAILTVQLFNQYSDNYFLSNNAPNNILNGAVRKTLPQTIINTETSLNAMLNGRLYQKYSPTGNIQFKDTTEQNTLYSALTECVLYRIQTGEYINLHNTYNGNITGTNNFSSGNSNVIGLRNDIRDKLVYLGLYQSGSFTNATLPSIQNTINPNILTAAQWSAILNQLASAKTITFNGTVNLNGSVSMIPSQVQLGHYGPMENIYKSLMELGQILSNYTGPSWERNIVPLLVQSTVNVVMYQPFRAEISFDTSEITYNFVSSNLLTINAQVSTNKNNIILTLSFSGVNGLHIEPQFNNGYGWMVGTDSCILNPNQTTSTNWNVSTAYPSWSYTFQMENSPSFTFTIKNNNSGLCYSLLLQGYFISNGSLEIVNISNA